MLEAYGVHLSLPFHKLHLIHLNITFHSYWSNSVASNFPFKLCLLPVVTCGSIKLLWSKLNCTSRNAFSFYRCICILWPPQFLLSCMTARITRTAEARCWRHFHAPLTLGMPIHFGVAVTCFCRVDHENEERLSSGCLFWSRPELCNMNSEMKRNIRFFFNAVIYETNAATFLNWKNFLVLLFNLRVVDFKLNWGSYLAGHIWKMKSSSYFSFEFESNKRMSSHK